MRDAVLLGARMVLGGYLAVHDAQKLFGTFHQRGEIAEERACLCPVRHSVV